MPVTMNYRITPDMDNKPKTRDVHKTTQNKIILWNAQGLSPKLNELKKEIENINPDIIGIVETWYSGNEKMNTNVPNYNSINKPRQNKRGGGLQLLIKKHIS